MQATYFLCDIKENNTGLKKKKKRIFHILCPK